MESEQDNDIHITGVMVQYHTACKTELWYFANHINYNDEDENINIGRLIHQESFKRQKMNVQIGNSVSIDYIISNSKGIIIHEVKKSSRLEKPVRNQVLYYLWYLKKRGVNGSAIITYPKERKKEKLFLSGADQKYIEDTLLDIKDIIRQNKPPAPEKKSYCRKCSYFQLCWC